MKPRLGLTMGDPAGIGPEVILKTLCDQETLRKADVCVIGHEAVFFEYSKRLGISPVYREAQKPRDWAWRKVPFLVSVGDDERFLLEPGRHDAATGRLSFMALERGVQLVEEGVLDGLVTAPISKIAWSEAGVGFVGHTDFLSRRCNSKAVMMMVGGRLRVSLVTVHVPLRNAIDSLTTSAILDVIRATAAGVDRMFGIPSPVIAVAGVNPHGGEDGLLGAEDMEIIAPAIEQAKASGLQVSGPHPPDVVFRLGAAGKFDAVVAMYHDQGLIPVKVLAFEEAVNITLGIPILRTSPGHGTAFDIAGKGMARHEGMAAAIRVAASACRKNPRAQG